PTGALHALPFQRAKLETCSVPAESKTPPAKRESPSDASARARPFRPSPIGFQDVPFHLAMFLSGVAPDLVNSPAAMSSSRYTANAATIGRLYSTMSN